MHKRRLLLFAGALLAAVSLATSGAASAGPAGQSKKAAGTLVFGAEQGGGPDWCINEILDVDCNAFWNVVFQTPVIRPTFLFTPNFKWKPELISRFRVQTKPQRLTYYIRKNARWSDGVPVTAKDYRFTWQTTRDPKLKEHIDPGGYEDIRSVTGNGKVVKITFKKNFAGFKPLFNYVLPAHALSGANMLTVWEGNNGIINPKNGKPISDGPYQLTKFDRGCCITLTRSPRAWHGKRGALDSIVFRFITNTNSEIQAIRGGEVDAIYPQPQLALADLKGQAGLRIQSHLGLQWEHIEIQQGSKGNPLAKQRWVRQALALSINRAAAARALFGTLNPNVKVLQSLVQVTTEPGYKAHFNKWNYNPNRVAQIMRAHNCTKGGDGIYRCGGTKLTFVLESTVGNRLRELAFTIFQDQAAKAGIELKNGFVPAGTLFGSHLPENNFDLAMFTYLKSVDVHGTVAIFSCGSPSNYTQYCNRTVTRLLKRSDAVLNDKARVALVNRADVIMANDVPMIPLFQRPTYYVYKTSLRNQVDNPTFQGPSWNAQVWGKR
jgi:peptide/nickel transport system substrate-binding protein